MAVLDHEMQARAEVKWQKNGEESERERRRGREREREKKRK